MKRIKHRDKGGTIGGTWYSVMGILLTHWLVRGTSFPANEHLDNWLLPGSARILYRVGAEHIIPPFQKFLENILFDMFCSYMPFIIFILTNLESVISCHFRHNFLSIQIIIQISISNFYPQQHRKIHNYHYIKAANTKQLKDNRCHKIVVGYILIQL